METLRSRTELEEGIKRLEVTLGHTNNMKDEVQKATKGE